MPTAVATTQVEALRRGAGLSGRRLATLAGISAQTLANVEKGGRPTVVVRRAIAYALVDAEENLFDAAGQPLPAR